MRRSSQKPANPSSAHAAPDPLAVALAHQQAGRFDDAEAAFQRLLNARPDDAVAWHLWGVLAARRKQYQTGSERIQRALELKRHEPVFLADLGNIFLHQGQLSQAIACFQEVLQLRPDSPEARNNLGNLLQRAGRQEEAEAAYRKALELRPDYPDAHNNLGALLQKAGRQEEAEAAYQKALELRPDYPDAYNNLGTLLQKTGRQEAAETAFRKALELRPDSPEVYRNLGNLLQQAGRQDEAEAAYRKVLALRSESPEDHNNLGTHLRIAGRLAEAEAAYRRALDLRPDYADANKNLGFLLQLAGRPSEAEAAYRKALKLRPDLPEACYNLGILLQETGRHEEAEAAYRKALELRPDYPEAENNLGSLLQRAGRQEEAETAYRKAIELRPDFPEAHNNLGNLLQKAGRQEEAEAAYRKALELRPDSPEINNDLGTLLQKAGRQNEAEAAYRKALELRPDSQEAYNNLGSLLFKTGRQEEAEAAYRKAVQLRPKSPEAHFNLGILLQKTGREEEADAAYRKAVQLRPEYAEAHNNLGNLLQQAGHPGEALASFERVLSLDPNYLHALGMAAHSRASMCQWTGHAETKQRLLDGVQQGKRCVTPFIFLGFCDDPREQLSCAQMPARQEFSDPARAVWQKPRYRHERIRVAYISPDFRSHPVAFLIADVIERHDRARFEVFGISIGPDARDPWRERMRKGFDHFLDVRSESDDVVVQRLRNLEIDIAVDLAGYTAHCRTGIFASRCAPVQVNYLGFPGTMGADFIDYIFADRYVIPEDYERCYAEKVVCLPDTFQCSSPRTIAVETPSRRDLGLPETGFVFTCFNQAYKIHPTLFDIWMRLLDRIQGSVLWLYKSNEAVEKNLRREAEARGVDPDRLVFAPRLPPPQYLARYRQADLFLDTLPYNAGTTASDALWAGLPVLTCSGRSMASRMGGSVLHAIDLPELVTDNLADYEALALRLATRPNELAAIRRKLERNRQCKPLFDVDRFRRHVEAAYERMWAIHQRGEAPASFTVDPIAESEGENRAEARAGPDSTPIDTDRQSSVPPLSGAGPLPVQTGTNQEIQKQILHLACAAARTEKLPPYFRTSGWQEVRLDIEPGCPPDFLASMASMSGVATATVAAIFASHVLEHLYPHDVPLALKEFHRVLSPDGFALLTVPDLQGVAESIGRDKLDETAHVSPEGPITPLDMLYGDRSALARGDLFMAHRTGFTAKTLGNALLRAGFPQVTVRRDGSFGLWAIACRSIQTDEQLAVMKKALFPS